MSEFLIESSLYVSICKIVRTESVFDGISKADLFQITLFVRWIWQMNMNRQWSLKFEDCSPKSNSGKTDRVNCCSFETDLIYYDLLTSNGRTYDWNRQYLIGISRKKMEKVRLTVSKTCSFKIDPTDTCLHFDRWYASNGRTSGESKVHTLDEQNAHTTICTRTFTMS